MACISNNPLICFFFLIFKLISAVYETNQSYNDNLNTDFGRQENINKLDFDTNAIDELEEVGGNGFSCYSESSSDDSFFEEDGKFFFDKKIKIY